MAYFRLLEDQMHRMLALAVKGDRWLIKPELKKNIQFRAMNLIQPWPIFPPFDLVFIRNVMIYFDVDTKKSILKRIRNCLLPHSYLFLGTAETTINLDPVHNILVKCVIKTSTESILAMFGRERNVRPSTITSEKTITLLP